MRITIVLGIALLFSVNSWAQSTGTLAGRLMDETLENEPLMFAQVTLKNTYFSGQTNFHGNFEFNQLRPGNYTLVLNYLGYKTKELPIVIKAGETTRVTERLSPLSTETEGLELSISKETATTIQEVATNRLKK